LDGNFRERGGFGSKIYSKKVKDSTSATKTVYFIKFQTNTTTLVDIFCNTSPCIKFGVGNTMRYLGRMNEIDCTITTPSTESEIKYAIYGSLLFLAGSLVSFLIFFTIFSRRLSRDTRALEQLIEADRKSFQKTLAEQNEYLLEHSKLDRMFISWRFLEMKDQILGSGNFGLAILGRNKLTSSDVCLKVFHFSDQLKKPEIQSLSKDLFGEILRMSDLEHENILRVIGFSQNKEKLPIIVLPFMQEGDLLSKLRDPDFEMTSTKALRFCFEAASGMDYLSRRDLVHRDLAARNCLLDEKFTLKIRGRRKMYRLVGFGSKRSTPENRFDPIFFVLDLNQLKFIQSFFFGF